MPRNIAINSQSSGKFEIVQLNGRDHISTKMISLQCNSVMNGLAYPEEAVMASYSQLDNLPAPASHPIVNGERVSASHPLAVNAFNIGAMVSNPTIEGENIVNDLIIDKMVAEKDSRGVDLIKRIENGEQIGVSTGLTADIINGSGEMKGRKYNGMVSNIEFDHVAVLLNEPPAGENTYTVNSDQDAVFICNVEQSAEQKPEAKAPISTKRKGKSMEQENLVNAVIVNSNNNLTESDRETLMGLNENALVSMVCVNSKQNETEKVEVTTDVAMTVLSNSELHFVVNAEDKLILDGVKADQAEKRESLINQVVKQSEMTKEQLENMDFAAVEGIAKSLTAKGADFSVQGANVTNANEDGAKVEILEGS